MKKMENAKFVEEAGYRLTSDEIDLGSSSEVYRCVRQKDGVPVRVKVLSLSFPMPRHLSNFQHEYNIVESLKTVPGVVAIYDRISRHNFEALVLEDFGGEDLFKCLERDGPFAAQLEQFIDIAISLAISLGQIHSHSIVHKDIKPANIIWNRQTGVVKLTDLGIASVVIRSKDTNQGRVPFHALGSLPYLPPELSVRTESKSIDHRSDFYSLGVSFFQLLTGRLPFQEKTPIRLLHAHMAKPTPRLHEVDARIPLCLSLVVSKMMAKSMEMRYQSSRGLHADLLYCKQWLEDKREQRTPVVVNDFAPGRYDVSDVFSFPARLYGREREIQLVRKIYEVTAKELKSQVLLVAGYSGVGKTSLVNQLKVVKDQSYFIQGKYDYNKRDVPYSAIAIAFTDMIHQILSEDEESVTSKKERILEALGTNGQLLVNVIPSLQLLIGAQSTPHVDLGVTEMKTLFNQLFARLVDVFCSFTPGRPLVIFLDDLHWADHPSFQLLEKLTCRSSPTAGSLLLVGGYRDNEVTGPTHPLNLFVNELREKNASLHHICLQPLGLKDINEMVANVLHYSDSDLTEALSNLVFTKTKGNPFFIISFLTKLYQSELIWFDYNCGAWQWDLEEIQATGFTDNVVEFMAQDLRNLPANTLELLEVAAFFGSRFDVRNVAEYSQCSIDQAENDLWRALHGGFILRSEGFDYNFLHDRVQQAAYECVDKAQRKQAHFNIGLYLMNKLKTSEEASQPQDDLVVQKKNLALEYTERNEPAGRFDIFDVVYHLNKAAELIGSAEQRILLAKLNLKAAIKGKRTLAYDMARRVAAQGIAMLPEGCWTTHHKLTFQLYLESAQCEYLCKNVDRAQELFELLCAQAADIWEVIEVFTHRNQFYICLERYEDLVHYGFECLATLGVSIERNPTPEMVDEARKKVYDLMGDRKVADLVNIPPATDPRARGIQIVINKMCIGLFFVGNPNVLPLALCTAILISIEHGNDPSTAGVYAQYAWIACSMHRQALEEAYEWGKLGLDLCEKYAQRQQLPDRGQVWELFYSFDAWLKKPLRSVFEGLEKGFKLCIESGDLVYGTGCAYHLLTSQWCSGLSLPKILSSIEPYMSFARDANWSDLLVMMETIERHVKLLMDKPVQEEDEEYEQRIMSGVTADKVPLKYSNYCVIRMHYCYIMGQYSEALQMGHRAARAVDVILSFKEAPEFYFIYSLTILAICKASNLFISRQDKMKIDKDNKWKRVLSKRDDKRVSWSSSSKGNSEGRDRKGDSYNLTKEKYEHYIRIVQKNQAMLKKFADSAPCNYSHQYILVEAELTRVQERIRNEVKEITSLLQVLRKYDESYELALRNGFIQDAAVAKELAWQVLEEWAGQALSQAVYCYSKWGASAKAKAITQATASYRRPSDVASQAPSPGPYSTTEIISSALDLDTVIEASQQLSSKLNYSDLLTSLMDLTMSNTCATKGVLLLTEEYCEEGVELASKSADSDEGKPKQLFLKAKAECPLGEVVVKVLNVLFKGESVHVPNRVLNYCWRTKTKVLLRDATQDENFSNDVYIRKKRPFSILCTPITFKDKHYGILYFENDANTGIFTDDRLRLLQILTSQFMISIENSMLVERLKKTNKELKLKNNQLKEVDRLKDSFLAVASHELRTPLNGIIGMTSLLEDTSMTAEQKEYVDNIKASSETLMELVNDVLDLSKLKAMKVKLEEKRFSLAECLETSLKLVEFKAATKGLNLAYIVDPALPQYVVGDDMRLRQILLNLLNNSVKFTDSGEIVIVVSPFVNASPSSSSSSSASSSSSSSSSSSAVYPASRAQSGGLEGPIRGKDHGSGGSSEDHERSSSDMDDSSTFTGGSSLEEDGSSTQEEGAGKRGRGKKGKGKESASGDGSDALIESEDHLLLHFEVRDTGIGIKAEDFHVLFKPFSQVDTSLSRKYGGTGLGLSICKRLCKMFHGKIWAESRPQRGSIFHFTARVGVPPESELPQQIDGDGDGLSQETLATTAEPNRLPSMHALLYIANETNRFILQMHLTRCGTTVTVAETQEEFFGVLAKAEKGRSLATAGGALDYDGERRLHFAVLDTDTLGKAVAYLTSRHMSLPIILLSGLIEKETEDVQAFIRVYRRIHVMRLPLRQVRLLDDLNEIVLALDENRLARLSGRRVSSGEAFAFHRPNKDSREHAAVVASPTPPENAAATGRHTPLRRSDEHTFAAPAATEAPVTETGEAVTGSGENAKPQGGDHGLTATVAVPQPPTTGSGSSSSAPAVSEAGADKTSEAPLVLVVEDNAMNRKLLSQILYKAGYQYQTAENGEFALQAILKHRFDAILMDLQMPVLDGLETTRRIRTMEAGTTSRTPIIGITASVSEQDRAVCLGVGMDSFLSKPIKREHLLRILREWTTGPDKAD